MPRRRRRIERVRHHALQRAVVDAVLFDRFLKLLRHARPRHAGIVGDQRDRHAVLQVHRQRVPLALDAEDQIVAARARPRPGHVSTPSRGAAPADRLSYMTPPPCPMRRACPMRIESRMWKRSASGGTSPSTSSPACSAIRTSGYLPCRKSIIFICSEKSRTAVGSSSGCTRLSPTKRGSSRRDLEGGQHLREHLLGHARPARLRDVADGHATARVGVGGAASEQRALARFGGIHPPARFGDHVLEPGPEQTVAQASEVRIPAGRPPRAAGSPPLGVSISSR